MATFTFAEVRELCADRPAGLEGVDVLDELHDVLSADFHDLHPNAPEGVGWAFAVAQVSMAMKLGGPGDDNDRGGGRGPRKPAPEPEPAVLTA